MQYFKNSYSIKYENNIFINALCYCLSVHFVCDKRTGLENIDFITIITLQLISFFLLPSQSHLQSILCSGK